MTGAKKADTITLSIMVMTNLRRIGTPIITHWETCIYTYASIASEPDLEMSPKVIVAMLAVYLNSSKKCLRRIRITILEYM